MRLLLVASLFVAACDCAGKTQPTLKAEGEPCTRDDECQTGECEAPLGQPTVCRRRCASGCHPDELCEQLTLGRFTCVPDTGGLCRPCASDRDCPYAGDKCIVVDGADVCGRDCSFDQTCPASYRCLNAPSPGGSTLMQQCVPASGSCPCSGTLSCGVGACARTVAACIDGGANTCAPADGGPEQCNGVDDDCNGSTDEGLAPLQCGVGACERVVPACAQGLTQVCNPGAAVAETCNGVDDDCDGVADDRLNTTDLTPCPDAGGCADPHGARVVAPCAEAVNVRLFVDRAAFEAELDGGLRTLTFDCIDTSDAGLVAFPADLYVPSFGVRITGGPDGGGGQYAGRGFLFPGDYPPVSAPNMFAPGPPQALDAGPGTALTDFTFESDGGAACVAAFGAMFIDADHPEVIPTTLTVFGRDGGVLAFGQVDGGNASQLFFGAIAYDGLGRPVPALRRAKTSTGDGWAGKTCCEGVTLDDVMIR